MSADEAQVEQRQGAAGLVEEVLVPVPVVVALGDPAERIAAERQRDAAGPGFDQPPGQQEPVEIGLSLALLRILPIQAVAAAGRRVFSIEVERLGEAGRRQDLEGLPLELIQSLRGGVSIDPAAELVEAGQEGSPVREAIRAEALRRELALLHRGDLETGVGLAKETRLPGHGPQDEPRVRVIGRQVDRGRDAPHALTELLGKDRAQGGPVAFRIARDDRRRVHGRMRLPAGRTPVCVVVVEEPAERTDQREPIGHPGQPGQQLTDLDAGDACPDRPEFAADLRRRVGLQVVHVEVRRPAGEDHHDHRLCGRPRARGFRPQDLRQRQPAQRQAADLQAGATGDPNVGGRARSADRCHARSSSHDAALQVQGLGGDVTTRTTSISSPVFSIPCSHQEGR